MDYHEFRRHLGKAGLTVNEFAGLIGVTPTAVSNYSKKGCVPTRHAVIAVLLGDAADRAVNFRELLARFGIKDQRNVGTLSNIDVYRARARKAP